MKTSLSKGLDEKSKSQLKENFIQAQFFRKQLTSLLNERIEGLQSSMRDETSYDKPSWSEYQADKVGQTKAYLAVISLLNEKS